MFGLGGPEFMLIFGIGFLLFGGKKLPEMGEGLGRGIANFKLALRHKENEEPTKALPAPEAEKSA